MAVLFPQSCGMRAAGATARGSRAPGASTGQGCAQEPRTDSSGALAQGVSRATNHSSVWNHGVIPEEHGPSPRCRDQEALTGLFSLLLQQQGPAPNPLSELCLP